MATSEAVLQCSVSGEDKRGFNARGLTTAITRVVKLTTLSMPFMFGPGHTIDCFHRPYTAAEVQRMIRHEEVRYVPE